MMLAWLLACTSSTPLPPLSTGDSSTPPVKASDDVLGRFPPVVVATSPVSGAVGVEPGLDELLVTFSKPMNERAWSWVSAGAVPFPGGAAVDFETGERHVMSGLALDADTAYLAWLNDPAGTFQSFEDRDGRAALPYPLAFVTGPDEDALAGLPAAVTRTSVVSGSAEVDPSIREIEIDYSTEVLSTTVTSSSHHPGEELPVSRVRGVGTGLRLEVTLQAGVTYAAWIEVEAADGSVVAPYLLYFQTAPAP